jgi:hypothetical protein
MSGAGSGIPTEIVTNYRPGSWREREQNKAKNVR